jgi:hypothetical protein
MSFHGQHKLIQVVEEGDHVLVVDAADKDAVGLVASPTALHVG